MYDSRMAPPPALGSGERREPLMWISAETGMGTYRAVTDDYTNPYIRTYAGHHLPQLNPGWIVVVGKDRWVLFYRGRFKLALGDVSDIPTAITQIAMVAT